MTETNVQPIPSNSQHHDTPNNKTHVIKFRVTAEEKTSLELTCKLLNLSLSTFIRRIHVEFASSFIVLHNRVLSALRHLYSCDFCYTVLLIRFWTHSRREGAGIVISKENKKSEPFSYREKVRIFMVWCG